MNIYLVKIKDAWIHDEKELLLCYAESEDDAIKQLPYDDEDAIPSNYNRYHNKNNLEVKLIGENKLIIEESVILFAQETWTHKWNIYQYF